MSAVDRKDLILAMSVKSSLGYFFDELIESDRMGGQNRANVERGAMTRISVLSEFSSRKFSDIHFFTASKQVSNFML